MVVALPVAIPLAAAPVGILLSGRPRLQRAVSVLTLTATLAVCAWLLVDVGRTGTAVLQVGGWAAPFGISLVADRFATIMLTVSATIVLAVLLYAIAHPATRDDRRSFHAVYLTLAAGVSACFLAGDLFHLFVAFEVMLVSSYVLITFSARLDQVRSGMTYVVISLLASVLFITAVGLTYASTGTVNLADLVERIQHVPAGLRTSIGMLLLVVFGIKAAIFPLFMWLPDAYPTAPTPITAVFAGLLTKVGVYAIIRTQTLLFIDVGQPSPLLLAVAGATMVVGVLGALAQDDIKRILSFHIVSQIGYMIMGLGLLTVAGLAAAIVYIVHHIVVKTALFLVGGIVEYRAGTAALRDLGGFASRSVVTALMFALAALSLAGIPPLSGFVAKLALVQAGLAAGQVTIVTVALLVSLLTLVSMSKIWTQVFWGARSDRLGDVDDPHPMTAAAGAVVVVSLVVAVSAAPIVDVSLDAARSLTPKAYVDAVVRR